MGILFLIAMGAFTKSAIFPFHFWLPNAMTAPTPVSAYLHSATMVKAGVYLLARLRPVLGGTDEWTLLLGLSGATTILVASTRVLRQSDLKGLLAETTVIALGALVMMLGMPAAHAPTAVVVFIVVHALYKASLFMIVGIVDKQTGTRDLHALGGLAGAMPRTTAIAVLSGVAMMGLPPMFGFIGKELIYQATLGSDRFAPLWTSAALGGNALTVSGALLAVHHTFFGRTQARHQIRDASAPILMGPTILAMASLAFGVFHTWTATQLVTEAVGAIEGPRAPVELALWHGLQWALALSAITVIAGIVIYLRRAHLLDFEARFPRIFADRADRIYDALFDALTILATAVTCRIQSGKLRDYVFVTVGSAALLPAIIAVPVWDPGTYAIDPFELGIAALTMSASVLTVISGGRIVPLICAMVVGFGVALIFVLIGAPDVAFTQFAVETLLVVFVTISLGRFEAPPVPRRARWTLFRDTVVALFFGGTFAALVLEVLHVPLDPSTSEYFLWESVPLAHGRNVVNTILVDFRALDTLGEITVLSAAALGAFALLKTERRV